MVSVGLSQQLFNYVLLLLQKAGTLNLDITGDLVRLACCPGGVGQEHPVA